jgi:hypothetical protein
MGASNAANVGNLMTSGAAASAAGGMGQAQAIGSGLGTYLNYSQGNNLVQALRRNQPQFQPGSNAFVGPMPQYNPTPDFTYGYGQN